MNKKSFELAVQPQKAIKHAPSPKIPSDLKVETCMAGPRRSVGSIYKDIDAIEDKRGQLAKWTGVYTQEEKEELMRTIFRLEKDFEHYPGFIFPEEIIRHFGSWLLGRIQPINETHVNQLKELVSLGERLLFSLSNNMRSFKSKDVFSGVIQFLGTKQLKAMRLVSLAFRHLAQEKFCAVLNGSEITDPKNVKLQFGLKIKIRLPEKDLKGLIGFFMNDRNTHLAKRIDCIELLFDIDFSISRQKEELLELIKLLGDRCPNLGHLAFGNINANTILELKGLNNLTRVFVKNIHGTLILDLPKLTSFSCHDIDGSLVLTSLLNLSSFSCYKISKYAKFILPEDLKSSCFFFDCNNISDDMNQEVISKLAESSNLSSLYYSSFDEKVIYTLSQFKQLTSFHCETINQDIILELSKLSNLSSFSFEKLGFCIKLKIKDWKSLSSLSCGTIRMHAILKLQNLPKLSSLSFKQIESEVELQDLPELAFISISHLKANLKVQKLPKLSLFSCENIEEKFSLRLKRLPNLSSFSCKNISNDALVCLSKDFQKLVHMHLYNISSMAVTILPLTEELPSLQDFSYHRNMGNQDFKYINPFTTYKDEFENLQLQGKAALFSYYQHAMGLFL